jgi:hypothetical protein
MHIIWFGMQRLGKRVSKIFLNSTRMMDRSLRAGTKNKATQILHKFCLQQQILWFKVCLASIVISHIYNLLMSTPRQQELGILFINRFSPLLCVLVMRRSTYREALGFLAAVRRFENLPSNV